MTKAEMLRGDSWKALFLEHYKATGNVTQSAIACGVSRATVYSHRKSDPHFLKAMDDAEQESLDALEARARLIAMGYRDEDGNVIPPHARMLMFFLERRRPTKYGRHQSIEVTGAGGGPVAISNAEHAKLLSMLAERPRAQEALTILAEELADIELELSGVIQLTALPAESTTTGDP